MERRFTAGENRTTGSTVTATRWGLVGGGGVKMAACRSGGCHGAGYHQGISWRRLRLAPLKVSGFKLARIAKLENTYVGPFLIIKRLGNSRRNRVYHARQTQQNRDVALKFITFPPKLAWEKALEKIQIESQALEKLRHPNLARIYGAGAHEGKVFFASALIEGESLAALLARRGRLAPDLVVEYGRQISEVLGYLHRQNLVHGSLWPDSILVTPDHQIKLTGLRLNQPGRHRWDQSKQRQMDSAAYQAPEQFSGPATAKSDVYALGVILFEMLTGKLPYELDTMGRLAKRKQTQSSPAVTQHILNCPIWLDQMVTRMLDPVDRHRPHSAREVALAFEELKKIDATGASAASQVSGNFNPLTKGAGKTDAKRLLEESNSEIRPGSAATIFQTVPFLLLSLVTIIGLIIWLAMPPSTQEMIAQTRQQVASSSPTQWRAASVTTKPLMESSDPLAKDAEEIYYLAKQKMLVDLARRGVSHSILQTPEVQKFTAAFNFELAQEEDAARRIYFELAQTVQADGDQRHVFQEAKQRFEKLSSQIQLPDQAEGLMRLVASTEPARSLKELEWAERYLAAIFVRCAGDPELSKIAMAAERQLMVVQHRKKVILESSTHHSQPPGDGD